MTFSVITGKAVVYIGAGRRCGQGGQARVKEIDVPFLHTDILADRGYETRTRP